MAYSHVQAMKDAKLKLKVRIREMEKKGIDATEEKLILKRKHKDG